MKRSVLLVLSLLMVFSVLLAACGGGGQAGGSTKTRSAVPAEFANKTNPHAGDASAAAAGKDLYQINCASCHGDTGKGDGPASASLEPKPYNLANAVVETSEGYLYYRIAEGGMMSPYNSSMPAWKAVLNEDQIWQVVTHMQTFK